MSRRNQEIARYFAGIAAFAAWTFCGVLAAEAVALEIIRSLI
jgi:hypothetical protein